MKIYPSEIRDGLQTKIQASVNDTIHASVTYLESDAQETPAVMADVFKNMNLEPNHLDKGNLIVNALLCTTNMNKNDDYFSMEDTYAAQYTPVFKPVNMNHAGNEKMGNQILGVMVNGRCLTDEGTSVHYNKDGYYTYIEDKPVSINKFHLAVTAMIWSAYFPKQTAKLKEYMDNNQLNCSMECLIDDFGYALQREDSDTVELLPRTELTAWLTKALRKYGGSGKIEVNGIKYKVGRWLRGITFSGLGLLDPTKTPGNPESTVSPSYVEKPYIPPVLEMAVENISDFAENRVLLNEGKNCLWLVN